jgi:hypothetical protein
MRSEVPPTGRAMAFPEWAEAIVAGVRRFIPEARAARKGPRHVIIRHGELEAHLVDDGGGAFVISFDAGDGSTTMSSLVDRDRRDAFTVRNLSQSVAGYFDARFTRAETRTRPINPRLRDDLAPQLRSGSACLVNLSRNY